MPRVLVVDDDPMVCTAIESCLQRQGFVVTIADGGEAGIRALETSAFDVVLVDIFMPGMDGLETMKLVHKYRPGVPIIVISGHAFSSRTTASPDFLAMSTRLGAVFSLQKPFKAAVLLSHVAHCLEAGEGTNLSSSRPADTASGKDMAPRP